MIAFTSLSGTVHATSSVLNRYQAVTYCGTRQRPTRGTATPDAVLTCKSCIKSTGGAA